MANAYYENYCEGCCCAVCERKDICSGCDCDICEEGDMQCFGCNRFKDAAYRYARQEKGI